MAFESANFLPISSLANSNAPRQFSYKSDADNLAAVKTASYFDDAAKTTGGLGLKDGDVIYVKASDASSYLDMAVSGAGVATVNSDNDFA